MGSNANCSSCINNIFGGDELVNVPGKAPTKQASQVKVEPGAMRVSQDYPSINGQYFKREEHFETITNQAYNPNLNLETRKYQYQTGAVYDGQWRGNYREG